MTQQNIKDEDYWLLSKFTIEKAAVGIFWVDPGGRLYRANEAAAKILGYTQKDLEAMPLSKIGVEYNKYSGSIKFWDRLREKKHFHGETQLYRKNGIPFPVDAIVQYVKFKEKEFGCLFFFDITKRKQTESDLRQALEEVKDLKNSLLMEKEYLEDEIKVEHNFNEIIGTGPSLQAVLKQLEKVAPTDTTVLIHGETGTGKELLARAIHALSPRSDRPLVKVNCAALPANLIESELFGHEKGAFTGALAKKSGRFELAHNGTIFLDEIGDLPMDLQVKLLRVLQEGEFECLGSIKTQRVDVRVIAATNRNLIKQIEMGEFREDLYYRLNVFPLTSPPLRDRKEDIPALSQFFLKKYSKKIGKPVLRISKSVMEALSAYNWPGNIRELQNIIERAIILSRETWLEIDPLFGQDAVSRRLEQPGTMQELERRHILFTLEKTDWRVSRKNGAAKLLGLKDQTLFSRMRKYNIKRK